MTFTSSAFLLFLFAAVLFYYVSPRQIRWFILLVFSYVFYLWGGIGVLGYILFTTLTTYIFGLGIAKCGKGAETKEEKKKAKKRKKLLCAMALVLNFGLLYLVKYLNFTLDLIKYSGTALRFSLIMPLGISFYIFQSMGYIIDLVRGKYEAQKNPLKLALFVSFFPQITQGPIGRYDALSPQLYRANEFSFDNIKGGAKLMFLGYLKKLVIADRASVAVGAILDNYGNYSGSVILFGVILYCIQLYCDFSGGIDIARGAARLFGIDMAENFRRPIFAESLADFWRRWHITLGSWLKDYLFYPITLSKPFISIGKFTRKHIKGKAGKILPTSLATFIVYFVIGIWHGASLKYILFGFWNGALITASLLTEPYFTSAKRRLGIDADKTCYRIFCMLRTIVIIVLGRFITRASGVGAAADMLRRTFTDFSPSEFFNGTLLTLGLGVVDYTVIAVGAAFIFFIELGEEFGFATDKKIEEKGGVSVFLTVFAIVLFFIIFGIFRGDYIASEFIYKQF